MKAMILAAGRGERLRPLTDTTPKPLIKANDKPLIAYLIENLVESGITDIIINTAYLAEQFPATLGDGSHYGVSIQYSHEEGESLETAGGIINALPLLGDEPFLVINGDIWTDFDFRLLTGKHLEYGVYCHLVLVTNPQHNFAGDFGLVEGRLMSNSEPKFTFSGIGLYHPTLFSGLQNQRLALKPIFDNAIKNNQISGQFYDGYWSDIGTIARLTELENMLQNNDD